MSKSPQSDCIPTRDRAPLLWSGSHAVRSHRCLPPLPLKLQRRGRENAGCARRAPLSRGRLGLPEQGQVHNVIAAELPRTRLFTKPGEDPLDSVEWGRRDSR